ncbi:hypothetical protein H8787_01475 [Streptococcus sp. NSJ-72]|uniref:hypothetical protein n=1 Tax=Streptococcus sp. NSJ-72 TaxID=2763068 RepID=UPI001651962C|nr:hypothetical protein [Streptococcus sp. NSJ-72]QNL42569.1 hypothetical protein H8787_01475 [Streptococcus sp. NSJ-72]
MITIGIDQFTLVLQSTVDFELDKWVDIAHEMINEFLDLSQLIKLYGEFSKNTSQNPQGYNTSYSFDNVPFYLVVAYHSFQPSMGIIIKFSAHAWVDYQDEYKQNIGQTINIHTFLQSIQSNMYRMRLSRIDLCVDFINEGFSVAKIARSFEKKNLEVRYGKYKQGYNK